MDSEATTPPNVLLVVLDSVRAANTSLHGHHNETTPFLDRLAEASTVFEQARSPGTESISSHTSIFTGYHVREHGITNRRHRLTAGHTIWERLADRGYETGVFSNNPFLTELPVGLSDAFDTVAGRSRELPYPEAVNPKDFVIDTGDGLGKYMQFARTAFESGHPFGSLINGVSFKLPDRYENRLPSVVRSDSSATVYADRFLNWEQRVDGPWAACVNFMDAHFPYEGGEYDQWGGERLNRLQDSMDDQVWEFVGGQRPWWQREALEALYDGAIRRMDTQLERIVGMLRERGSLENTLVVVTADHGEGFGERSLLHPKQRCVGHGNGGLYEALVHVPLVVRSPDGNSGRVVPEPASLTRFPSVVEAAVDGTEPPEQAFVDGAVVASTNGIDPDTQQRAGEYLTDIDILTTPADAVYRAGDPVRKTVRWGDAEAEVSVSDAHARWIIDHDASTAIDVVDELSTASVSAEAGGVSQDVEQRLQDLGYA
jgi:arylsulfatase